MSHFDETAIAGIRSHAGKEPANSGYGEFIGILQPMYLPWAGYFEQIASVDRFVLMDDVQYTKRDWRNRNRIKTAAGVSWLTVPVRHRALDTPINEIEIDYARDWIRKHLRTIEVNYQRRPHFQPLFGEIEAILRQRPQRLVDLNTALIRTLMVHLEIATPLSFSSAVPRDSRRYESTNDARNERILELCEFHRARVLYDGKSAASFLDTARFAAAGVEVVFQDYQIAEYPQAFGAFVPSLSTLDLVMNMGPAAGAIVRSSPLPARLARRSTPRVTQR